MEKTQISFLLGAMTGAVLTYCIMTVDHAIKSGKLHKGWGHSIGLILLTMFMSIWLIVVLATD